MKKIVAVLVLVALSAMIFACGDTGSAQMTASSSHLQTTKPADLPAADPVIPYADIDFADSAIVDSKDVISLKIKTNGSAKEAFTENREMAFMGYKKVLPVLRIENTGTWVKCVFKKFETPSAFNAFVAENGGFSVEAFYLDNSLTSANRAIVCCTESIGGDGRRSGWGVAEDANGCPYFLTGHVAENRYSSVTASKASETEPVHVVAVHNVAEQRNSIYINGTLASSDRAAGAFTVADKVEAYDGFNMGTVFYIGADPSATAGKAEKCDFPTSDLIVIDVKFYSKALSAEEVRTVYSASLEIFK